MNALLRDLFHAARGLRREPRFAVVTILILAVGIGACTAMFSIVHAVLLRPMALPAADRVVMLWSVDVRHESRIESTYAMSTIDVQHFTVRTIGDPLSATAAIAAAVKDVDPRLSVDGVSTMDAVVRRVRGPWHFTLIVFAVFGLIALALAVVGLVAVVSYAVTDRSREIGVRMALGATQGRVVRLMLAQAAGPAAVGLVAGAAASRALGRTVQPLLFDIRAGDSLTLALVVMLFALLIMFSSYLPARRAGRIDPQSALRQE